MKTIIFNGKLCLDKEIVKTDLLIDAGKIAYIGKLSESTAADKKIDAENMLVMPGLIDFHVHLDDQIGDFYIADSCKTGSEIAIRNGVTTICSFITQSFDSTLTEAVETALVKAKNNCYCDFLWHLTPTTWTEKSWEDILFFLDRGFKTLKLYTTYKKAGIYSSYDEIESILARLKSYNIRTLIHCEDERVLADDLQVSHDLSDAFSWTQLRSKQAEITAINKIVEIALKLEVPIHIVHVSTAEGAKIIQKQKASGLISCETAPQYLFFNDQNLVQKNGHRYLCTPPLRDKKNQEELKLLTKKNIFDIYATDHCPFLLHDKDKNKADVLNVPNGLPGIGALLHMVYKLYADNAEHELLDLVAKLSMCPAQLAGIYPQKGHIGIGSDADLVILDRYGLKRKICATMADCFDPYANIDTCLDLKYVFLRGDIVVRNNALVKDAQIGGKCLCHM